ncbi:hypothetical protein [Streptomyces sp. NPDC001388]|uniref:hypothetical protein n=1 Tax=Streptomyces sp. NPDC001388 TaxID=3364568 RepID=UPI003679B6D9
MDVPRGRTRGRTAKTYGDRLWCRPALSAALETALTGGPEPPRSREAVTRV